MSKIEKAKNWLLKAHVKHMNLNKQDVVIMTRVAYYGLVKILTEESKEK